MNAPRRTGRPQAIGHCIRLDQARKQQGEALSQPRARLLVLGFAGGSVTALVSLACAIAPHVEVWGLEYPGRGMRWQQAACSDADVLLDELQTDLDLLALSSPLPLALLGYSMGGHVALQLAHRNPEAVGALIVMGARPPQRAREDWLGGPLSDSQLVTRLQTLGGMPAEVLASPVLMENLLPVMRADLSACVGLAHAAARALQHDLPAPLLSLQGREDPLLQEGDSALWQQLPQARPELGGSHRYPGGHFFYRGAEQQIATDIGQWMDRALIARAGESAGRPAAASAPFLNPNGIAAS